LKPSQIARRADLENASRPAGVRGGRQAARAIDEFLMGFSDTPLSQKNLTR
jgi:hypothetical protein